MANDSRKGGSDRLSIKISFNPDSQGKRPENVFAYLFNPSGQLVERVAVAKGEATFAAKPPKADQSMRIMIGPDTGDSKPTVAELRRRGASEHYAEVLEGRWRDRIDLTIDSLDWGIWILGRCCVRGKVVKRVGSGSNTVDLPVCTATVEVYEVDPIWILLRKLPDLELDRFRQLIIKGPPDPGPKREIVDFKTDRFSDLNPQPLPPRVGAMARLKSAGDSGPTAEQMQSIFEMPSSVKYAALTGSLSAFRAELALNPDYVWPLFCWYWWRWVTKTKVGEGTLDAQGRFNVCFWQGFFNPDIPDLWFKVIQDKGTPLENVIYEHYPVPCWTWWDYQCGSEVVLYADQDARTCYDDPIYPMDGEWVILEALGTILPDMVYGLSQSLAATTSSGVGGNIGTIANGGPVESPFANLIRTRLQFSSGLRALGTLYRVSASIDGGATWTLLDGEVRRTYVRTVNGQPAYDRYKLGPSTSVPLNFFQSQPLAAPSGGAWTIPASSERDDLTSAYLPTIPSGPTQIDHGKVMLKVEIFTSAGAPLPMGGGTPYDFFLYVSETVDPISASTLPATVTLSGNSMTFTLHVDNRPCYAEIKQPAIGSVKASLNCGGLNYSDPTDDVTVPFTASQPDMRCTHGFSMVRGANNAFPYVESADATPGEFHTTSQISDMLAGCSGAAFSANLGVHALATDGWDRQAQFDRYWVYAFMLTPGPAPHP